MRFRRPFCDGVHGLQGPPPNDMTTGAFHGKDKETQLRLRAEPSDENGKVRDQPIAGSVLRRRNAGCVHARRARRVHGAVSAFTSAEHSSPDILSDDFPDATVLRRDGLPAGPRRACSSRAPICTLVSSHDADAHPHRRRRNEGTSCTLPPHARSSAAGRRWERSSLAHSSVETHGHWITSLWARAPRVGSSSSAT